MAEICLSNKIKDGKIFPGLILLALDFGMVGRKMTKLAVLRTGKTCKPEVRHIAYLVNTGQDI